MSNRVKLRVVNPGSGQLCRPRNTWKLRPPRGAQARYLWFRAVEAMQGRSDVQIPDHMNPDLAGQVQAYPELGGLVLSRRTADYILNRLKLTDIELIDEPEEEEISA